MISEDMENDWHTIIFPIYGGGQESGFISAVYREETGYELDEESFVREEPKVSGDRILSDNLINDMDTDNYLTIAGYGEPELNTAGSDCKWKEKGIGQMR